MMVAATESGVTVTGAALAAAGLDVLHEVCIAERTATAPSTRRAFRTIARIRQNTLSHFFRRHCLLVPKRAEKRDSRHVSSLSD